MFSHSFFHQGLTFSKEEGSSTIPHSVYLDDFSSVLPEKINRAYLLSIVDVVESQILPRLTNFLLFFLFGFAWFGVTFFYLTWWLFTLSFYGIFSFILFSSARSCFSVNLPYTFGQVLQLCSYNLTLPFLVGFFRSDFWGYFIGFGFMVYSLVTKPQHHRHHRNH